MLGFPLSHPVWTFGLERPVRVNRYCLKRCTVRCQLLLVGFSAGALVIALGSVIGGLAGYFGGWIDSLLSLVINVFLLLPGLPLMVVIAAWLPPGPVTLVVVLGLTGWAWNARVIRAQVATMRE